MRERPILFSGPLVQAVRDDRKTQTRRVIVPQPRNPQTFGASPIWGFGVPRPHVDPQQRYRIHAAFVGADGQREDRWLPCPYGRAGDQLWIRETWWCMKQLGGTYQREKLVHRADAGLPMRDYSRLEGKWRPSIFMPRWASRVSVELVEIRAEPLQAITEADAEAEGITRCTKDGRLWKWGVADHDGCPGGALGWPWDRWCPSPIAAFRQLWDDRNGGRGAGAYRWDANPFVWVLTFRRLSFREQTDAMIAADRRALTRAAEARPKRVHSHVHTHQTPRTPCVRGAGETV